VLVKAAQTHSPNEPAVQRHDHLGMPGFDLFCPTGSSNSVREAFLAAGATAGNPETYEILRIEAGIPRHGAEIEDERFVVELNRPQAICYTKGCYLGQEPIVMARDRGHVNRKLMGLKLTAPLAVSRGIKVFRDAAEIGQVTSSVVSPRVGPIALAYLRRGHEAPGTTVEVDVDGQRQRAEVVALPFKADASVTDAIAPEPPPR
jgi:folate-binding protein YgfZ